MVAKVRFWLLESSRLIAKASFSVMILKSLFLYSLFITRPCFKQKATPPQRIGNAGILAQMQMQMQM